MTSLTSTPPSGTAELQLLLRLKRPTDCLLYAVGLVRGTKCAASHLPLVLLYDVRFRRVKFPIFTFLAYFSHAYFTLFYSAYNLLRILQCYDTVGWVS